MNFDIEEDITRYHEFADIIKTSDNIDDIRNAYRVMVDIQRRLLPDKEFNRLNIKENSQ